MFGHIHGGGGREDIAYDAVEAAYDGILGDRGLVAGGLRHVDYYAASFRMPCRPTDGLTTLQMARV